jgi:ketosteroid isomerase-like protein
MERDGSAGTITAPVRGGDCPREAPEQPDILAEEPALLATEPALAEPALLQSPEQPTPEKRPTTLAKEKVVAGLFDAFSRGDLESALAFLHPEVVFQPMTAAVTRAGEPYRGHEGIRCYTKDVETYWETLVIRPQQIRCAGEAVVALGLVSGSGPGGSFEDAPTTWVVKFREGLVVSAEIFSDARHVVSALVGEDA